jgi:hypothetical protein
MSTIERIFLKSDISNKVFVILAGGHALRCSYPPLPPLTTITISVWLLGTVDKKDGGFSFSILYTYMHV